MRSKRRPMSIRRTASPASVSSTPIAASASIRSRRRSMADSLRFRDDPVHEETAVTLDAFLSQSNATAVRLEAGAHARKLVPYLERNALIEIVFPRFRAVWGYSGARLPRDDCYTVTLRHQGAILVDHTS